MNPSHPFEPRPSLRGGRPPARKAKPARPPWGRRLAWGLVLTLLLAACGSAPTPLPAATPTAPAFVTVARPPDLAPWDAPLSRCAQSLGLPLLIHQVAWQAVPHTQADLLLSWGAAIPAQAQAFALGEEAIWAIAHVANPTPPLEPPQLQALFLGRVTRWEALHPASTGEVPSATPVLVWVPQEDNLAYPALEALLGGVPPTSTAQVVPSAQAALEAVAHSPASVALLPERWLTAEHLPPPAAAWVPAVRRLSAAPLAQVPVIALTWGPPSPQVHRLLACLQQGALPTPEE